MKYQYFRRLLSLFTTHIVFNIGIIDPTLINKMPNVINNYYVYEKSFKYDWSRTISLLYRTHERCAYQLFNNIVLIATY